jgi:hypothetical protein
MVETVYCPFEALGLKLEIHTKPLLVIAQLWFRNLVKLTFPISQALQHDKIMRRILRMKRPIGLLKKQTNARIPSPLYLCLACRHQNTSFSTSALRPAPKLPYTEKVRQRIWGTDKPPGLEDPYGDASVFDQLKKRAPEQELEARNGQTEESPKGVGQSATEDPVDEGGYEPATSVEGLQWVGGDPVWQPEEDFAGFLPADAARDSEQITAALHRAVVEAFALQQARKPLHWISALETNANDDWTDNVQITPSPTGATLQLSELGSLQQVVNSLETQAMEEGDYEVEPTEFQEDVFADRSEVDPLKDGVVPSTEPTSELDEPTESEDDPLVEMRTYEEVIASWDPSWLQISIENPEVKFAVSSLKSFYYHLLTYNYRS